jgi:hypothetical protein
MVLLGSVVVQEVPPVFLLPRRGKDTLRKRQADRSSRAWKSGFVNNQHQHRRTTPLFRVIAFVLGCCYYCTDWCFASYPYGVLITAHDHGGLVQLGWVDWLAGRLVGWHVDRHTLCIF